MKKIENAEYVKSILSIDPLSEAEKITGKSYKEDKLTEGLGFLNHLQHGGRKRQLLESIGDTTFGSKIADYERVVKAGDFKLIYQESFLDNQYGNEEREESLYVFYQYELGIVLTFDTYWNRTTINSGKFYYNWSPNVMDSTHSFTSSGHFLWGEKHIKLFEPDFNSDYIISNYPKNGKWGDKDIDSIYEQQRLLLNEAYSQGKRSLWVGDHDCREGLLTNITNLMNHGKFITPWKERHLCFWITHYMDWKQNVDDKEYKVKSEQRIAKFPKEVRDRILS